MAYGTKVEFEAVREVAFGAIGAAYSAVGVRTIDYTRLLMASNDTDADVYVSFDGTTDHIRIKAGSQKTFDLTANTVHDDGYFLDRNTQIFIKRVSGAPTTGLVWFEVMYGGGGK